jgi:hypothetical protein
METIVILIGGIYSIKYLLSNNTPINYYDTTKFIELSDKTELIIVTSLVVFMWVFLISFLVIAVKRLN